MINEKKCMGFLIHKIQQNLKRWNISLSANLLFLKSDILVNKLQQLQPTICHCSVLTVKVKLLIWRLSDLEILYYCIFSSKYNLDSSCSCREMLLSCISTFLLSPHTVFIWNTDNKYYRKYLLYYRTRIRKKNFMLDVVV